MGVESPPILDNELLMAAPGATVSQVVRFGVFEVDTQAGELRRNGAKVKLEGQPFTVLMMLLERPGQLVTREELKEKLWPSDTFVDFEHSINVAVKRLREALQDSATAPRYIETLPKRGYRFIYPLNGGMPAQLPVSARSSYRWWYLAIATIVLLLAVAVVSIPSVRVRLFGPSVKRIAVLPLHAQSTDPEQTLLADGFTEMMITELGSLAGPEVLSHQSVLQYAKSDKSVPQIAQERGVDAVIEGTVLRSGNRVRVTINFVLANPELHLLARAYEVEIRDVFAAQREVATDVAQAIRMQVPEWRQRRAAPSALSPEVADALVRGFAYYRKGTDADRAKAADSFAKAVELDPNCALGYAYLAILNAHGGVARQGGGPENRKAARQWAEKALQLDENLAEAHTALAWLQLSDWRFEDAEREFQRAIALNRSLPTARTWYAQLLAAEGRVNEAIKQAAFAIHLDPAGSNNVTHAAWSLMAAGKVDEAIGQLRVILDLDPHYIWAHRFLGEAFVRKGQYSDAIAEFQSAAKEQPGGLPSGMLAYAFAQAGKRAEADEIARDLDKRWTQAHAQGKWIPPNVMVPAYLALGDRRKALAYLELAYERPAPGLAFLNAEECYRPLRSEPRFQELVRRVGLPPIQ